MPLGSERLLALAFPRRCFCLAPVLQRAEVGHQPAAGDRQLARSVAQRAQLVQAQRTIQRVLNVPGNLQETEGGRVGGSQAWAKDMVPAPHSCSAHDVCMLRCAHLLRPRAGQRHAE